MTQNKMLLQKFLTLYWRNANYNFVRFTMTVVIGVILGLVYQGQAREAAAVCGGGLCDSPRQAVACCSPALQPVLPLPPLSLPLCRRATWAPAS